MENKELKIKVPEGYEIDEEKSSFEKIVFRKTEQKKWRNDTEAQLGGYFIDLRSEIAYHSGYNTQYNYNLFATKEQAKAALAMARISQIMAYDKRFGESVTKEEWANDKLLKYVISYDCRDNKVTINTTVCLYKFLTFHTREQAELFLNENKDLVNDYFMIS